MKSQDGKLSSIQLSHANWDYLTPSTNESRSMRDSASEIGRRSREWKLIKREERENCSEEKENYTKPSQLTRTPLNDEEKSEMVLT